MNDMGLRKPSAFSVIEFGKEVHGFHTADRVNPYSQEVYRKVESLTVEVKMVGYVPDLSYVLHGVEEEDKEHILNYHNENLSAASGIMKIDPEISIQVTNICASATIASLHSSLSLLLMVGRLLLEMQIGSITFKMELAHATIISKPPKLSPESQLSV